MTAKLMDITHTMVGSPLGELTLVGNGGALAGVYFTGQGNRPRPERLGRRAPAELAEPARQLGEYFAGQRTAFELELDTHGDAFDRRVWALVAAIPYGQTRSYGEIARAVGAPIPLTDVSERLYAAALDAGHGGEDLSVVVQALAQSRSA